MSLFAPASIRSPLFWDGVAWVCRWLIAFAHLLFMLPALFRAEVLEGLPAYRLFAEITPLSNWAAFSFLASVLLIVIPTRVPYGLLSTTLSALLWFVTGSIFALGVGMIFGSLICYALGGLSMALFMRSLWASAIRLRWFRQKVMRGHHDVG